MLHHAEMSRLVQLPQGSPHPTFRHSTAAQVGRSFGSMSWVTLTDGLLGFLTFP